MHQSMPHSQASHTPSYQGTLLEDGKREEEEIVLVVVERKW